MRIRTFIAVFSIIHFFWHPAFGHPAGFSRLRLSPASDTSDERIKDFKVFADKFFEAVGAGDTAFLKKHILFPITHSSFSGLDESLSEDSKIDARILFRKLHRLFPKDYLSEIKQKGEYHISAHKNFETKYIVSLYHNTGGVESNSNWHFVKRNGEYYFTTFTAEAG